MQILLNVRNAGWHCKKFDLLVLRSTPIKRTFNGTSSLSDTNCQGTEFLHCNVLCFTYNYTASLSDYNSEILGT